MVCDDSDKYSQTKGRVSRCRFPLTPDIREIWGIAREAEKKAYVRNRLGQHARRILCYHVCCTEAAAPSPDAPQTWTF